jgi:replicative DNA helicase
MNLISNIETEESILGGILLDTEAMSRITDILAPEHFFVAAHRIIYSAAKTLYSKNQPTDFMTVTSYLKDKNQLDSIGGSTKISQLIARTVSANNIHHYARLVWEKWWLREYLKINQEFIDAINSPYEFSDLKANISEKLSKHLVLKPSGASSGRRVKVSVAIEELINQTDDKIKSISTGVPLLDEKYPIFGEGILTAFLARPNKGKTQVKTWLYCQHIKNSDRPCLYLSLEMTRERMAARFVASSTQIPINRIERKDLSDQEWERFWEYYPKFMESNAYIDDTAGGEMSIGYICEQIDHVIRETGQAPTIFLDYAQLVGDEGDEVSRLIAISRGLKNTANKYRIPIIFSLQLNRNCESRNDKRPQLSDISYGDKFSHDLDGAFGLYADWHHDPDKPHDTMQWINLKNRHGEAGFTLNFSYDPSINQLLPTDSSQFYEDF